MRGDLEWRYLKGLYKLYTDKSVRNKLMNDAYIKNILYKRLKLIGFKNGNKDIIESKPRFNAFFEKEFLEKYLYYVDFFENAGLDNSGLKTYDKYDLETLMFIHKNKQELKESLTTVRSFSSLVFKQKDSKYLESKPGLLKDVLKLLQVERFPNEEKANQWKFTQDCEFPEAILLCENIDFIKAYWEFTTNNIELWYAGGNNTAKLKRVSKRNLALPLYYVCDWDYHGLKIYERIVEIFEAKGKNIHLITPKNIIFKPIDSGHHKSKWLQNDFSNLNRELYTKNQVEIIDKLISNNLWIEEQTISPIEAINELKK
ncbi:MAG: hypothetical protein ABNH00_11795 [Dokdonia sp.]|jgi:hypothetical protein